MAFLRINTQFQDRQLPLASTGAGPWGRLDSDLEDRPFQYPTYGGFGCCRQTSQMIGVTNIGAESRAPSRSQLPQYQYSILEHREQPEPRMTVDIAATQGLDTHAGQCTPFIVTSGLGSSFRVVP